MSNIIKMLRDDEGFRPDVYTDTMGYETIGIGFCLDRITIPDHIKSDWEKAVNAAVPDEPTQWPPMPEKIADEWLEFLIGQNRYVLQVYVDKYAIYENLSQVRRDVIDDMCYQLGVSGVCRFNKMWKCLKADDHKGAAVQMRDSSWRKQTENRCDRLAWMMEFDELHEYYK